MSTQRVPPGRRTSGTAAHVREIWRHRELVATLVAREVSARYRGSVLGWVWSLLQPVALLAVYWLVFSRFTRAVNEPRYALMLFCGLLPWTWLSSSVTTGSTSIVYGSALVTRAAVPPQVLPLVAVLANLAHLALALPVALAASLLSGVPPTPGLLLLPVVVALQLPVVYGLALVPGVLTVRWRDVQFLVQTALVLGFFLTPVVYSLDGVPPPWRSVLAVHPGTLLVGAFQATLLRGEPPRVLDVAGSLAWACVALPAAVWVFEGRRDAVVEGL